MDALFFNPNLPKEPSIIYCHRIYFDSTHLLTIFRLSQNIAGITILAFGNGAPDIFSSLAGVGSNRPELVFGALFGAGMFVTTVVAGAICWLKPFDLMKRPFLRDISFYLIAVFWSFCIFFR